MSFRISYQPFFTLDILHGYFLDQGGRPFDTLDQAGKAAALNGYQVSDFMSIQPSAETVKLMKDHHMIARQTSRGLTVGISAVENGGLKPKLVPSNSLKLTFHLFLKDPLFFNYTNLRLDDQQGKVYYFSNQANNYKGSTAHLTKAILKNTFSEYFAGDLRVNTNSNTPGRLYEAIEHIPAANSFVGNQWREWPAPKYAGSGTYHKGDYVYVKSGGIFDVYQALVNTPATTPSAISPDWEAKGTYSGIGYQFVQAQDRTSIRGGISRDTISTTGIKEVEVRVFQALPDGTKESATPIFTKTIGDTSSSSDLGEINVDIGHLPPRLYKWEVYSTGGTPTLLPTKNQGIFYLNNQFKQPFGIVEIFLDPSLVTNANYQVLGSNDVLNSPTYVLQFKNRSTYWRYRLNATETLDTPSPLVPCIGTLAPTDCYESRFPLPLTKVYEPLQVEIGGNKLFAPSPPVNQIIPQTDSIPQIAYNTIYSDIYLRNF